MTSASKQIITRCPKCGTAFRVTPTQLQSAKGAVRCGSCLHVFKAQEYVVASQQPASISPAVTTAAAEKVTPTETTKPAASINTPTNKTSANAAATSAPSPKTPTPTAVVTAPTTNKPASLTEPAILSAIKPLSIDVPAPAAVTKAVSPQPAKPVVRVIDKSSLAHTDDILISDDMDDHKEEHGNKSYEFDSFMDIDMTPKSEVSLFERKIRDKDEEKDSSNDADESWAEMLIDEEDDDTPQLGVLKPKTEEQLADEELKDSYAINTEIRDDEQSYSPPSPATPSPTPGLMFSLVGEPEEKPAPAKDETTTDDFVISDELARIPSNQGFTPAAPQENTGPLLDPTFFDMPSNDTDDTPSKSQVKTQPKIRAYDGSRTALLMNIIPAPIEFTAKRMRRWYQRKLWPSLSLLALIALIVQVGWFKFDYFSRAEPYRTGYLFLCPYIGCQVPTLVDTSRIVASNLVVREIPETPGALAVDVMIINNAPFEQPYPDLILVFTDINEKTVASRRFTPKEYLGGEVAGQDLMPQNQKVHISLDMIDPGPHAVNYHIDIPR
ncbi:MAG: DUF3426 domain-containing protein [Cellvibrio sp.]|uniref:DUF3426 domain-containing protein n=1 Tax=Cellvibrio sp. TaxID=1965322 RepID=UPI0031B32536